MKKEVDITSEWRYQDLPEPIVILLEKWQGIADEEADGDPGAAHALRVDGSGKAHEDPGTHIRSAGGES